MTRLTGQFCAVFFLVFLCGCEHGHDHTPQPVLDSHSALHVTKYNEVLVEFPGHKYAMEIVDEKETTGLVTAYLTDAHFEPVSVDTNTNSVKLNFVVAGTPTTYTLQRSDVVISLMAYGQIATFTLTDAALATLICEGWEGEATAVVEIGGVPYTAPLIKLSQHTDHSEHSHAH